MSADPVLVIAWLVLAHLVADFVLQTDGVAADKIGRGRRAVRGLALHVGAVLVCMAPFAIAFGVPGLVAALAIAAAHAAIDHAKVVLTRRAEARALHEARAAHEPPSPAASLGTAWTPVPALLFALDQLAHLAVIAFAWAAWLEPAPLTEPFTSAAGAAFGRWDQAAFHRATLILVVLAALAIVNVRAASFFVATLVRPREALTGSDEVLPEGDGPGAAGAITTHEWSASMGPVRLRGRGVTTRADGASPAPQRSDAAARPAATASPARIGATIGVLERLLIVAFMMTGAQAAVGFVVAAKTIARFKQLDDRHFAEYYLLGTLASVSVAIGSALVASAALAGAG